MRIALYGRVSTTNHGQDPEMQLRELRAYASARGFEVTGEYVDRGVSGAKASRPQLDRLMTDAQRRRFDAVVVWKFDRFARSVSHLLRALETFKGLGIEFISFTEGIDTGTAYGKMTFTVLGAVAELERSLTVERIHAGLKHARGKGKTLGRPRVVVDRYKIAELRGAGKSWSEIVRETGLSQGTCQRAYAAVAGKSLPKSSCAKIEIGVDSAVTACSL